MYSILGFCSASVHQLPSFFLSYLNLRKSQCLSLCVCKTLDMRSNTSHHITNDMNANVMYVDCYSSTRLDPQNLPQFWSKVFLLVITERCWQFFFCSKPRKYSFLPISQCKWNQSCRWVRRNILKYGCRDADVCAAPTSALLWKRFDIYVIWCDNTILLFQL